MGKVVIESPLVHSLFKCSLCHGLIRSATVINECLHRFCKFCITDYFEKSNQNTCPTCHVLLDNPMDTLKSDLIFQRLLFKLFPSIFQSEITYKPLLLSSSTPSESSRIHFDTTIDVDLVYWDIESDLFPNSKKTTTTLPSCYLECVAGAPLTLLERFIRLKHSLPANLQVDIFYEKFLLNKESERIIDVCYCFDQLKKYQSIQLRFLVSPFGYKAILNHIRRSKQVATIAIEIAEPSPLQIEVPEKPSAPVTSSLPSSASSSSCDSPSADSKIKVKIRRSQVSTNDWYIPQSALTTVTASMSESVELPDLVNSCETVQKPIKRKNESNSNSTAATKKKAANSSTFFSPGHVSQRTQLTVNKPRSKPRRRTRFIPTMVKAPPSIFDRLAVNQYDYSDQESESSPICPSTEFIDNSVTTLRPDEMVIVNVEGNVTEPNETRRTQKTICKVPPYVPEPTSPILSPLEKTDAIVKPTAIYPTISPTRRSLLPKRLPSIIPTLADRVPPAPEISNDNDVIPLDLSLK